MNAMIVVKTKNGYAVAPFSGDLPRDWVQDIEVAHKISSYSYGDNTVEKILEAHFEPPKPREPAPEPKIIGDTAEAPL